MKFRDPCLNRSREVPPKAVGSGICSFFRYKFRPDVEYDVISGMVIDHVGMHPRVQFGDSRSKRSRDIRMADRTNERVNENYRSLRQKRFTGFSF